MGFQTNQQPVAFVLEPPAARLEIEPNSCSDNIDIKSWPDIVIIHMAETELVCVIQVLPWRLLHDDSATTPVRKTWRRNDQTLQLPQLPYLCFDLFHPMETYSSFPEILSVPPMFGFDPELPELLPP